MASGKQILISLLKEYSQKYVDETDIELVTERLRAGLLLHCSSAPETLRKVEKIGWLSDSGTGFEEEENFVWRQGLGLENSELFLTDFLNEIFSDPEILDRIDKLFPRLTLKDCEDAAGIIKGLFTSIEYSAALSAVENSGKLSEEEKEELINGYRKMLDHYRKDENYMY